MAHGDHHGHEAHLHLSGRRLLLALAVNLLLTVVEVIGGILSGSLALLSDALHNFSDCGSLVVALVAQRVARRPTDNRRTLGYRRAEVIGALINLTALDRVMKKSPIENRKSVSASDTATTRLGIMPLCRTRNTYEGG